MYIQTCVQVRAKINITAKADGVKQRQMATDVWHADDMLFYKRTFAG